MEGDFSRKGCFGKKSERRCFALWILFPFDYDIYYDGGTNDGGDGIEGNDCGGREGAEEIAKEGYEGT